jgi:predicted nucleic acid-binding protein
VTRNVYLADSSVYKRWDKPVVLTRVADLADAGQIATCTVVDIEVGNSARSPEDHHRIMERRRTAYPWFVTPDDAIQQAWDIHLRLAAKGHRKPGVVDLLIAVTALEHGLTVLHYDGDYDRIAEVTGQPTEWVVPAGTAD